MDEILIVKKKEYKVVEELGECIYKVTNADGKLFVIRKLGCKTVALDNFLYAYKRLNGSSIRIPEAIKIDKKTGNALLEFIDGPTVFDMLLEKDLDDEVIKLAFGQNFRAKVNGLLLDFNPQNFRYYNGILYYMPFTFDAYTKDQDFSLVGIKKWFYTKEFRDLLKEKNIPVNESRILPDFEQNRRIVLSTVKFYQ